MVNTDGGTHVDLSRDPDYVRLLSHTEGVEFSTASGSVDALDTRYVDGRMRQMAHELLQFNAGNLQDGTPDG